MGGMKHKREKISRIKAERRINENEAEKKKVRKLK